MDANIKKNEKAFSRFADNTEETCENVVIATSSESIENKLKCESELKKLELATSIDNEVIILSPVNDAMHSGTLVEENTQMLVDDMTSNVVSASKKLEADSVTNEGNKSLELMNSSASEEKDNADISLNSEPVTENDFSSKLEETVIIESDEEMKKGEESCEEKSFDLKAPASPQDLFASQLEDGEDSCKSNCKEGSGSMDFEDFIPPSQSDVRRGSQKLESSENSLTSLRKRKIEDDSQELIYRKISRMQGDLNDGPNPSSNLNKIQKQSQEPSEEKAVLTQPSSKDEGRENERSTEASQEQEEQALKGDTSAKDVMTSRKSVEIVFTSLSGSSDKESSQCGQEFLPSIPEENGETFNDTLNDSQDLVLRLSVSPSQNAILEEKSELENSKGGTQTSNSSSLLAKSSRQKPSASASEFKTGPTSASSSHSSRDSKTYSEVVTVDENDDVEVLTVEMQSSQTKTSDLKCHENGTSKISPDGTDDSIVIDDEEKSSSSSVNHKDMNGTFSKRKRGVEKASVVSVHADAQGLEQLPENESRKRSRLMNANVEGDRSTPDIMPLPDKESPAVSFEEVERSILLSCRIRVQLYDQSKHVYAIEMVECQEVEAEGALLGKTSSNLELSPGALADVSEQSKSSSPSSVTSLGPFQLKSQSWRLSTSSSSTNSSGHSIAGGKSRSAADWLFVAPLRPPPNSRNVRERQKNLTFSQEFMREIFEMVEKRLHADEAGTKLLKISSASLGPRSTGKSAPTTEDVEKTTVDDPESVKEDDQGVPGSGSETPRSTKKSKSGRGRNVGHTLEIKTIKEVKEVDTHSLENTEKENEEQKHPVTPTNTPRKGRRTPVRSNKRAGGDERKTSTASSGRGRRNRNEVSEKSESNSQEASQHTYEWDSESCFSKLMPDAPVFARWTDKKYYSGKVKEKTKDGRWVIHFDDNNVKALKDEFIIPINNLIKGQIVFAEDDEGYEQGIIIEFKVRSGEVQYGVELDSGRKVFVPRSRLFMSEDQARLLQENMDPKSPTTSSPAITTVTCDNIVQHKRPRSTRVLFGNVESPGVSGVPKISKRSAKSDPMQDTSCSSSVSDSNDKGSLFLEEVSGVDPEVASYFPDLLPTASGRGKGPGRIKSKSRTPRRNTTPNHSVSDTEDHRKVIDMLGPVPEKGSKLFSNYCFLLTYAGVKSAVSGKVVVSPDHVNSDYPPSDEDKVFSKFPFVREHVKKQIEAGGGKVYENFEDIPENQYENCFLVSDRPSLTAKYILCLVNNIRIISHDWVIRHCMGEDLPWRSARLEAGYDLEGQCFVPAEAGIRTRKQKPLSKKEVGLVNDSQAFNKFWGRVLELLGAAVRQIAPEQDQEFLGVDVIVTDNSCPPGAQDRACEWSIPLVSPVWITQSLINWKARSYDHSHYRYDFCASD